MLTNRPYCKVLAVDELLWTGKVFNSIQIDLDSSCTGACMDVHISGELSYHQEDKVLPFVPNFDL